VEIYRGVKSLFDNEDEMTEEDIAALKKSNEEKCIFVPFQILTN
jgi:hypothetical protein